MSSSIKKQQIWLLNDGRLGHLRQMQALLAAIQAREETLEAIPVHQLSVKLPALHRWLAPSILPGAERCLNGLNIAGEPIMIIAAGRRGAWLSRLLHRRYPQTFTIQILDPQRAHHEFSQLIIPEHDGYHADKVIKLRGSLTACPPRLNAISEGFWPMGDGCKLGVLLAGDGAQNHYLLSQLSRIWTKQKPNRMVISVGPRTAASTIRQMKKQVLTKQATVITSDNTHDQYQRMLQEAEQFWVAADSINQVSEVLTVRTTQPVWVATRSAAGQLDSSVRKQAWLSDLLERDELRLLSDYPHASTAQAIKQSQKFWRWQTNHIAKQVLERYRQHAESIKQSQP